MKTTDHAAQATGRRLLVLATVALCFTCAPGQVKDSKRFAHVRVSPELRERLAVRFNLFVAYERDGKYDKQFDLLSDDYRAFLERQNVNRDNYAEFKRKVCNMYGDLVELKVTGADRKLKENKWLGISVRARLRKDNKTFSENPIMHAYLSQGDWFFSMIYVQV